MPRFEIRISPQEQADLRAAAQRQEKPIAEYVRSCVPELQEGKRAGRPAKQPESKPVNPTP